MRSAEYEQVINRDEVLHFACVALIEEIQTLLASFISVCEWTHLLLVTQFKR